MMAQQRGPPTAGSSPSRSDACREVCALSLQGRRGAAASWASSQHSQPPQHHSMSVQLVVNQCRAACFLYFQTRGASQYWADLPVVKLVQLLVNVAAGLPQQRQEVIKVKLHVWAYCRCCCCCWRTIGCSGGPCLAACCLGRAAALQGRKGRRSEV